jgi:uncharacterized membrane protein YcaP (DUF421 family)
MEIFEHLSLKTLGQMGVAAFCICLYLMLITRLAGKGTFATRTSFDFAVIIAVGSVLADAINKPVSSLFPAFVSLGLLAGLQVLFSKILNASDKAQKILAHTPILLMKNEGIFEENLKKYWSVEPTL